MINALFPALNWIDAALGQALPLVFRVVLYGLVCGAASILIYRVFSNQKRIGELKREGREIRSRLLDPDAENFGALVIRNTVVSFTLLARVFVPSLIAALPVIVVAAWAAIFVSYEAPPGKVALRIAPPQATATLRAGNRTYALPANGAPVSVDLTDGPVELTVGGRTAYAGTPLDPPVPSITKRLWWSALIENPSGYIDGDAAVDELSFALSPKRLLPGLPDYIAGWELPFFLAVFLSALGLKFLLHVE